MILISSVLRRTSTRILTLRGHHIDGVPRGRAPIACKNLLCVRVLPASLVPSGQSGHALDEDSLVRCEEWEARCAQNSTQDLCAPTKSLCSGVLWSQAQRLRLLIRSTSAMWLGFAMEVWQRDKFSRKFRLKERTVRDRKSTAESTAVSHDLLKRCTLLRGISLSFPEPLQAAVPCKAITAGFVKGRGWSPADRYGCMYDWF